MSVNSFLAALTSLWISVFPADIAVDSACSKPCTTSQQGVDLIAYFEGYSPVVYKDVVGLPTIGYGHLIREGEVLPPILTPDMALELLKSDVGLHAKPVNKKVKAPLKQNQFDATVSFVYNLGEGAFSRSTLLKRINAERHDDVPAEFRKWVFAGGAKLRGLVIRRNAEAALYSGSSHPVLDSLF